MNRYRIIVKQLVPDEKLAAEDQFNQPAGRYLYAAGDPAQAMAQFRQEVPIGTADDFDVSIEPFKETV